ncbi:GNAT family N-acetyltransferase [Micromonospora matsumotoense]|uniref:GNAT family N-acetyltransferase n=1 Tax=Micromonospora matsumotoense TaxID=121616 RepID=UPI0033F96B63
MFLRDVLATDVEAYLRMRCDPVMMAELGGPLPATHVARQVRRDAQLAADGTALIKMIVVDDAVAGTVTLWRPAPDDGTAAEIGWMVLPEFQGRGLAKQGVRTLLDQARAEGRRDTVHAFPAVTNGPSNGICRALGFTLRGEEDVEFNDQVIRTRHWTLDLTRHRPAGESRLRGHQYHSGDGAGRRR